MPAPDAVLFDVNGTLTELEPIGTPWGRPELGPAVLDGAITTGMAEALLGATDRPFSDHLRAALEVLVRQAGLDAGRIDQAMELAAALPARPGAEEALRQLGRAGARIVALTNSGATAGTATLRSCGLLDEFERVLGVDAVSTFKPDPAVYDYALAQVGRPAERVMLVATHPWDLAGAARAGMRTAWVTHGARAWPTRGARSWPTVFPSPEIRGDTLLDVAASILR